MLIKAVDLFCGVGGLTCGLQQAGIPVAAGIDVDVSCAYAYTHNNHTAFIHKSVSEITGKELRVLLKDATIKVLVGCAPCQPFSSHQKDKHHRSRHKDWHLLYEFARLVRELKPHIVSMENVPELAQESVFRDFVATLEALNFKVHKEIVNAADYGVPQRRKRLILLASRLKSITLLPPTHTRGRTVRETIALLPHVEAGSDNPRDPLHIAPALSPLNLERIRHSLPGGTWRDWPEELRLACHKRLSGQTYAAVYGRMRWDQPAPTLTTQFTCYGTGRFGHPEQDRALTLREGALLQTFPRDYAFLPPDTPITIQPLARLIGNAVPPRLGEIIGKSILESLPKRYRIALYSTSTIAQPPAVNPVLSLQTKEN